MKALRRRHPARLERTFASPQPNQAPAALYAYGVPSGHPVLLCCHAIEIDPVLMRTTSVAETSAKQKPHAWLVSHLQKRVQSLGNQQEQASGEGAVMGAANERQHENRQGQVGRAAGRQHLGWLATGGTSSGSACQLTASAGKRLDQRQKWEASATLLPAAMPRKPLGDRWPTSTGSHRRPHPAHL